MGSIYLFLSGPQGSSGTTARPHAGTPGVGVIDQTSTVRARVGLYALRNVFQHLYSWLQHVSKVYKRNLAFFQAGNKQLLKKKNMSLSD